MQKNIYNKKVLLYSGGMDSWLIDKLWKPDIKVFVKIGTRNNEEEEKRLPSDVIVRELPLSDQEIESMGYYLPLRNLLLVELASYYGDDICIGAVKESVITDNNAVFANLAESVINYLWHFKHPERNVKIHIPFAEVTKAELLRRYIEQGGNIESAYLETFSCYSPVNGKECGKCKSCKQKIEAFKANGYKL